MIEIDGSKHEGGGQMFRMALTMASGLRNDVHIYSIRKGRKNPGLGYQHLNCLKWIHEYLGITFDESIKVGSTDIVVRCKSIINFNNRLPNIKSKTASSVTLYAQLILPILENNVVKLEGATDTNNSPPLFFLKKVLNPMLNKLLGYKIIINVKKHGYFYTNGKGIVSITNKNSIGENNRLILNKLGSLIEIDIYGFQSDVDRTKTNGQILSDCTKITKKLLRNIFGLNTKITIYEEYRSQKSKKIEFGITILYKTTNSILSGSSISNKWCSGSVDSEKEKWNMFKPENVAKVAVNSLMDSVSCKAFVDEHLADQLIIFFLKHEISGILTCPQKRSSQHLESVVYVANQFLPNSIKLKDVGELTYIYIFNSQDK